jgi:hypothetical protein
LTQHRVPPPLPTTSRPPLPPVAPPPAPGMSVASSPALDPAVPRDATVDGVLPARRRADARYGSAPRGIARRSPMIISLVVHTLVLLLLALTVPAVAIQRQPITISLAFDDPLDEPLLDPVAIEEMALPAEPVAADEPLVEPEPLAWADLDSPPPPDAAAFDPGSLDPPAEILAGVDLAALDEALAPPAAPGEAVEQVAFRSDPAGMAGLPAGLGGGMGIPQGLGNGIGGQIGQRLRAAGAGSGDVQISIAWDNLNDIDLHVQVQAPNGRVISNIAFYSRRDEFGGMLDIDRNAGLRLVPDPVENVYWPRGAAPRGIYTVGIHHFRQNFGPAPTAVEIVTLVDGREERYKAMLNRNERQVVTTFVR